MKQKTAYLLTCLKKLLNRSGAACPSCGCTDSELLDRKYFVTTLRRCKSCRLMFRMPTTSETENASFYQETYSQGFTTDCPNDESLKHYMDNRFHGTEKDYSKYIQVLEAAGVKSGARIFDFGCSWGYGSWQLAQSGFDVEAFEISRSRAAFAKSKLGIRVHSALEDIPAEFDVFFSAHVLEHVPSVRESIGFGISKLKSDGLFVAFTPNGSMEFKDADSWSWRHLWGLVHPNFLDDQFYQRIFQKNRLFLASDPYPLDLIATWSSRSTANGFRAPLAGIELVALARV